MRLNKKAKVISCMTGQAMIRNLNFIINGMGSCLSVLSRLVV